jgi:hypothetical protein
MRCGEIGRERIKRIRHARSFHHLHPFIRNYRQKYIVLRPASSSARTKDSLDSIPLLEVFKTHDRGIELEPKCEQHCDYNY